MGTVFIRKDAFEQLQRIIEVKFFAFSEKYLDSKGYCDDSAYHFEICDGKIVKSVANYQRNDSECGREVIEHCLNCKYGFFKPVKWDETFSLEQIIKMYSTQTEDETLLDMIDDDL